MYLCPSSGDILLTSDQIALKMFKNQFKLSILYNIINILTFSKVYDYMIDEISHEINDFVPNLPEGFVEDVAKGGIDWAMDKTVNMTGMGNFRRSATLADLEI
jgi:hypothetical protein